MCDDMRDHWEINSRIEELLMLLDGLVVGIRGPRKKALDKVLAEFRYNYKAIREAHVAVDRRAHDNRDAVESLERERRGLQKRIATLETEHKAEVARYKAALADVAKDLAGTGSAKGLIAVAKAAGQDSLGLVNDPEAVAILEARAKTNQ